MDTADDVEPPPSPEGDESSAIFSPEVVRGLLLCVVGCMFAGMALWILALDPNIGGPRTSWNGWRIRDVILTLSAAYCLRATAQYIWVVLLFQWEARHPPVPHLTRNLGSGAWQLLGCVVAVAAFGLAPYGLDPDALGFVSAPSKWLVWGAVVGFVAGPGAVLLFIALGLLTRDPLKIEGAQADFLAPRDGQRPPRLVVAGMILVGVVLAPCAEEMLFRGVVYPGLRSALGPWPAVILSAILFGLAHRELGGTAVVFSTAIGIALALLVEGSGSIWPAVLAHVLVNSKLVVMYLGSFRDPIAPAT